MLPRSRAARSEFELDSISVPAEKRNANFPGLVWANRLPKLIFAGKVSSIAVLGVVFSGKLILRTVPGFGGECTVASASVAA